MRKWNSSSRKRNVRIGCYQPTNLQLTVWLVALNKFESLVYGQELLLSIDFRKISSSGKTLSENQRLRLWRKGDTKSLLFYTTNKSDKSKGRYHPVLGKWTILFLSWHVLTCSQAGEVSHSKTSKTSLELTLQNNTHDLKDLKIEFENKSGQWKRLSFSMAFLFCVFLTKE